jgi:hypothetical protein
MIHWRGGVEWRVRGALAIAGEVGLVHLLEAPEYPGGMLFQEGPRRQAALLVAALRLGLVGLQKDVPPDRGHPDRFETLGKALVRLVHCGDDSLWRHGQR